MGLAATVLRNVASSWLGFGSQILITLLLTPYVISKLGVEAYGVWLLLQGTLGYYGFVDLGLRAGLTQTITRRIATRDFEGVSRHIGAATPFLAMLGGLVVLVSLGFALALPELVSMDDSLRRGLWLVILVQGIGAALQMPFAPVTAVIVGLQRFDIGEGVAVCTRLLSAMLTWLAMSYGGGLLALSLIIMVVNLTDSLIRLAIARRLVPELRNIVFTLDRQELKELGVIGTWNFVIQVSKQINYFSSALIIGLMFSARAVAPYGIASSLVDYGNRLVMISTRVLFPTMVQLGERGNIADQRLLFVTATRLAFGVSIGCVVAGYTWIVPFLGLWLGDKPGSQEIIVQAPSVFLILGIAFSFVSLQRVGTQLLLARNEMAFLAKIMMLEAFLNIVTGVLCGWQLGPIGIAVGTLVPAILCTLLLHMPNHSRALAMPLTQLLSAVLVRPALFGLTVFLTMSCVRYCVPALHSWFELVVVAGISATLIALLLPLLLSAPQVSSIKHQFLRRVMKYQT